MVMFTSETVSLNTGYGQSTNVSYTEPTGYRGFGIIGCSVNNAGISLNSFYLDTSNKKAVIYCFNGSSSSRNYTVQPRILFIKNKI